MKTTSGPFTTRRGSLPLLLLALLGAGMAGVARGQVITEFPVPTAASGPEGITAGPDGNLWFTEFYGNQIARITTAGVVTEFPIPTAVSRPGGIAAGSDGNLWFTELHANQIGRITTAGVATEFPIPTASSSVFDITAGPDGNLWFTEYDANQIGRITTAGVITEFPIPTAASGPEGITAGPDGNLWFTELLGSKIGRITPAGEVTEFPTSADSYPADIASGSDGNLWFIELRNEDGRIGRITTDGDVTEFFDQLGDLGCITAGPDGNLWFSGGFSPGNFIGRITPAGVLTQFAINSDNGGAGSIAAGPDGNLWFTLGGINQIGRITTGPTVARPMAVDAHAVTGSNSDANSVLEPGETVQIAPSWKNTLTDPQTFTGTASNLAGPTGPTYTIDDSTADYGTIGAGATGDCTGTGDCYLMTVSGARPTAHWDVTFTEALSSNLISRVRTLHVGDSFADVPRSHQFYTYVENLFHNGITHGCGFSSYCPSGVVTRRQMAVFLMKTRLGSNEIPPPATGTVFNDVHAGDPYADWIEQLAGFQITGGCGNGNYCPDSPVTRAQVAVFLLKAEHGSSYTPPNCAGTFADVACPSQFANWIEQLSAEGITGGCGGGNYCPGAPNTRGQMAVFLVKTFGLQLYGP